MYLVLIDILACITDSRRQTVRTLYNSIFQELYPWNWEARHRLDGDWGRPERASSASSREARLRAFEAMDQKKGHQPDG